MEGSNASDQTKSLSGQVGEKVIIKKINEMIVLLNDKKKQLNKILKLAKEQKEFIQNQDMDGLNKIISEKEKIMLEIDESDIQFLSLYNEVKKIEGIKSIEEIDGYKYSNLGELKEIVGNINIILSNISAIDKENTKIMRENLDNVKLELKQVKEVKKAYKGYNYEGVESILIDEKK